MTTLKHISTRNEALPTVSIVTVTYNANALVENTLDNIRKQDYPNKEIIVIDGNSTDGTTDIIKSCAARGSVTKWISENDNGIYDAMNKGVNMATGEWIIFMNAGDYFASDNVLSQIFCQDFSNADVIYGDVVKDGQIKKAPSSYYIYHRMLFCHQCVFTRRQWLIDFPFDTRHRLSADYKFFISIYQHDARFKYVGLPIAVFDTQGISNRQRSKGLKDNICIIWETFPLLQSIKLIAHIAVPYIMCLLRGK